LLRKLTCVEITNCARLNFRRIKLRVVDRLFAGLDDDVPDGFSFFLQVTLKIGASTAENVNFVHDSLNLPDLLTLSSRAKPGTSPTSWNRRQILRRLRGSG
jgi:hypothetical protein